MTKPVYFADGPLQGVSWQPGRYHEVHVILRPDGEHTYQDTGRETEDGERIYEYRSE